MDVTTSLRVLHDLSLATWFGGSLMGTVGLNGASIEVDDHTQRTRVANAGWFRWAPVAGAAIAAQVGSAMALGLIGRRGAGRRSTPAGLRRLRTVTTVAAALATLETGISGRRLVSAGDVPVATAVRPVSDTPDDVARAQHRLRVGQWAIPALTGALLVVDVLQRRHAG